VAPSVPSWEVFVTSLGETLEVPPESILPESRVIEDLDADSVALLELVVAMMNEYSLAMPNGINPSQWEGLTAGQLFDSVRQGSLP
jgi:acyl carrier protein